MKTIKKGVSVLLAFLLVLGMLAAMPATVSAATDDSQVTRAAADDEAVASAMYGDFKYDVMKTDDGYQYIAISGYTGSDTFVYIPDQIKGLYVQMIADGAFAQNQTMHEVRIPDYVEYIGMDAFSLCENLVNVYLPDYLYILSPFAFYGCTSLNYILIPSRVESYGYGAFAGCLNLKSFSVGAGNRILTTQGGVLYSNDEKILVEFPAGYEKTTFQVPSGVEMIAPYAFMWNNNLKEINIQNKKNCRAIGDYAFAYAISLQQVAIPATVTKIGEKILDGIPDVTIYTESDSYAHKYGTKNNIKCAFTVKSIKLNTNKISWPVGKSGSFKPTVTPSNAKNKALTWKSSNPKVATVDANGKLKAVGVGSTTITCTAKDGSGAKATCEVTVYDPKVSVYKVGDKITYTAYLSGVNAPLCGLNASIRYDGGKVRFNDGSLSFPYIGKPIYNAYEKNEIMFNITNLDGFDFSKQEVLVQATFTVTNASFTSKDISLQIQEMLDFNAKDLKGTIKETVARG